MGKYAVCSKTMVQNSNQEAFGPKARLLKELFSVVYLVSPSPKNYLSFDPQLIYAPQFEACLLTRCHTSLQNAKTFEPSSNCLATGRALFQPSISDKSVEGVIGKMNALSDILGIVAARDAWTIGVTSCRIDWSQSNMILTTSPPNCNPELSPKRLTARLSAAASFQAHTETQTKSAEGIRTFFSSAIYDNRKQERAESSLVLLRMPSERINSGAGGPTLRFC